ncbi:MAG TPA: hypothetical protein VGL34_24375 [Steroidobacteraceae bacterium]
MKKSTPLQPLLERLTRRARALQLTDTDWASRARIRKETLSRMRGRRSCDLATLQALAEVVGACVTVEGQANFDSAEDARFPARVDRDLEEHLLTLCASGDLSPDRWLHAGPRFFMSGLAVMIGGASGFDRRALLELAECLHAGSTQVDVFAQWLECSPVRPSRFLAMLAMQRHAA